jgi:hypothetical protein
MKNQEFKIAAVAIALMVACVAVIQYGKPRLGNPGVVMEKVPLTNELGGVVREERVRFPANVPGYVAADGAIYKTETEALPKDTSFGRKIYIDRENRSVMQFSAVGMKTDRTSIHLPQICVLAQGWQIVKSEIIEIPVANPAPYKLAATCLTLSKTIQDSAGNSFPVSGLYVYWFVSENRLVARQPEALWNITKDLLTSGTLHPFAVLSCIANCNPGEEGVLLQRMKRLIASVAPETQATSAAGRQTAMLDAGAKIN